MVCNVYNDKYKENDNVTHIEQNRTFNKQRPPAKNNKAYTCNYNQQGSR